MHKYIVEWTKNTVIFSNENNEYLFRISLNQFQNKTYIIKDVSNIYLFKNEKLWNIYYIEKDNVFLFGEKINNIFIYIIENINKKGNFYSLIKDFQ